MTHSIAPSEARFLSLLAREFQKPTYAILKQVPVPVHRHDGWHEQRVDAVVIGAWESRGTAILGFEIKASRPSWLTELKDPSKAEGAALFCDAWYVLADEDVVRIEEMPKNWGLYVPRKGRLVLKKPAISISPKELGREALFSILKEFMLQVNSTSAKTSFKKQYDLGYQAGKTEAGKLFKQVLQGLEADRKPDQLECLRRFVFTGPEEFRADRIKLMERLFESFTQWNSAAPTENAIKAVEFLSENGTRKLTQELLNVRSRLQSLLESVDENVNNLKVMEESNRLSPKDPNNES